MTDGDTSKKNPDLRAQVEQIEQDLRGIRRALRKPLEIEVARGELTAPQTAVMREVVRTEGVNLRDLSRAVGLAHSTVSGIVDRLEKRGLIERRADANDGRASCIYPTTPVREFVQKRLPALTRGPLTRALQRATLEERTTITAALRRLSELLGEQST
jgi:DNA-binding MarR family transcriptional regulator